jgi:hypothetical protein
VHLLNCNRFLLDFDCLKCCFGICEKTIRLVLFYPFNSSDKCQEIASPSRSSSEASQTISASLYNLLSLVTNAYLLKLVFVRSLHLHLFQKVSAYDHNWFLLGSLSRNFSMFCFCWWLYYNQILCLLVFLGKSGFFRFLVFDWIFFKGFW